MPLQKQQNPIKISLYFDILNMNYRQTRTCQEGIPFCIIRNFIVMAAAVYFHNHLFFRTIKVNNVITNGVSPAPRSGRELSAGYYTAAQAEAITRHVFGVDTQLIIDQTYFVIEHEHRIIACGGWSRRRLREWVTEVLIDQLVRGPARADLLDVDADVGLGLVEDELDVVGRAHDLHRAASHDPDFGAVGGESWF